MIRFHTTNWYVSAPNCNPLHVVFNRHSRWKQESSLSSVVSSGGRSYVYFKFEPFVLHVVCRTREDAQEMVRSDVLHVFTACKEGGMKRRPSTHCLHNRVFP